MTKQRESPYVWVTWLSRLMAGEINCYWAPWFRSHYTGYTKAPSDFQLSEWVAEHTRLLDELTRERMNLGEIVYKEDQNRFRVRRPSGLTIAGKPDLITVTHDDVTIYDAKTGRPKHSDEIQVRSYMLLLPYSPLKRILEGRKVKGQLVYKSGEKKDIPFDAIAGNFPETLTYFLNLLESPSPPPRTPSLRECLHCDITSENCPDRIGTNKMEFDEDVSEEIPF